MTNKSEEYRVGLILPDTYNDLDIEKYSFKIGESDYNVTFYRINSVDNKYCDMVIYDNHSTMAIENLPIEMKNCHGSIVIINKSPQPLHEQEDKRLYSKAKRIKYRKISKITAKKIIRIVNSEIIKDCVINGKIGKEKLILNRYTFTESFAQMLNLGWLIIPFILIVFHFFARLFFPETSPSLLYWFSEYNPNFQTDIVNEFRIVFLIYTVFNLLFYFKYILSIFNNINNGVFQTDFIHRSLNTGLQILIFFFLFSSTFVILKSLFIAHFGFGINKANNFININNILNQTLPIFRESTLVYYFLGLDILLYFMAVNYMHMINSNSMDDSPVPTINQQLVIKDAKRSFKLSAIWNFFIIVFFVRFLIYNCFPESNGHPISIVFELVALQAIYLGLNISIILENLKYR